MQKMEKPFKILISSDTHYSISKAAALLGLGTDNVVIVESDEYGRMKSSQLEEYITSHVKEGTDGGYCFNFLFFSF